MKNQTIADVARRAHVSIATASRVISHSDHPVSPATRQRVLQAVQELGFEPSTVARALVTNRTRMVGVIVGDTNDPYFSAIVRGIEDMGREHGYLVVVCNSDRVPEVELAYVQTLINHQIDGLIFAGGGLTDPGYLDEMRKLVSRVQRRGGSVVALSEHLLPVAQVGVDNRAVARDAVDYLIACGHRHIATITGPGGLKTTELRTEGYRDALGAHHIRYDPAWVIPGDFRFQGGKRAVEQLLETGPLPTAIFASNDEMAIGAMVALKEHGKRIPEDISLIGLDDVLATQYVDPALTTVRVPLHEMGAVGMRQVVRALQGEPVETRLVLPHHIVERKSVAAPR